MCFKGDLFINRRVIGYHLNLLAGFINCKNTHDWHELNPEIFKDGDEISSINKGDFKM